MDDLASKGFIDMNALNAQRAGGMGRGAAPPPPPPPPPPPQGAGYPGTSIGPQRGTGPHPPQGPIPGPMPGPMPGVARPNPQFNQQPSYPRQQQQQQPRTMMPSSMPNKTVVSPKQQYPQSHTPYGARHQPMSDILDLRLERWTADDFREALAERVVYRFEKVPGSLGRDADGNIVKGTWLNAHRRRIEDQSASQIARTVAKLGRDASVDEKKADLSLSQRPLLEETCDHLRLCWPGSLQPPDPRFEVILEQIDSEFRDLTEEELEEWRRERRERGELLRDEEEEEETVVHTSPGKHFTVTHHVKHHADHHHRHGKHGRHTGRHHHQSGTRRRSKPSNKAPLTSIQSKDEERRSRKNKRPMKRVSITAYYKCWPKDDVDPKQIWLERAQQGARREAEKWEIQARQVKPQQMQSMPNQPMQPQMQMPIRETMPQQPQMQMPMRETMPQQPQMLNPNMHHQQQQQHPHIPPPPIPLPQQHPPMQQHAMHPPHHGPPPPGSHPNHPGQRPPPPHPQGFHPGPPQQHQHPQPPPGMRPRPVSRDRQRSPSSSPPNSPRSSASRPSSIFSEDRATGSSRTSVGGDNNNSHHHHHHHNNNNNNNNNGYRGRDSHHHQRGRDKDHRREGGRDRSRPRGRSSSSSGSGSPSPMRHRDRDRDRGWDRGRGRDRVHGGSHARRDQSRSSSRSRSPSRLPGASRRRFERSESRHHARPVARRQHRRDEFGLAAPPPPPSHLRGTPLQQQQQLPPIVLHAVPPAQQSSNTAAVEEAYLRGRIERMEEEHARLAAATAAASAPGALPFGGTYRSVPITLSRSGPSARPAATGFTHIPPFAPARPPSPAAGIRHVDPVAPGLEAQRRRLEQLELQEIQRRARAADELDRRTLAAQKAQMRAREACRFDAGGHGHWDERDRAEGRRRYRESSPATTSDSYGTGTSSTRHSTVPSSAYYQDHRHPPPNPFAPKPGGYSRPTVLRPVPSPHLDPGVRF